MSANSAYVLSDDGFYAVSVERTSEGLRLSAGDRNLDASAVLSPAQARAFASAVLRQANAMEPAPPLPDARVTLLAQQVVDALNDCNHGGGGTPVGCASCEPMLAALREAGVELDDMATSWPYWRLKP